MKQMWYLGSIFLSYICNVGYVMYEIAVCIRIIVIGNEVLFSRYNR